jgi:RNA polymerase sigma factor (sigma-70 family)
MSMMVRPAPLEEGPVGTDPTFEAFFADEFARLARALFLLTGTASQAEELAQEAMVRVYERWAAVSRMDAPTGYLYRTAMNLQRSRLRRIARAARRLGSHETADPIRAADDRDELRRSLASLPVGQRQAVVLVEWLGFDPQEAARLLGIAPVSVRVRISRAKATLRASAGGTNDG